MIQDNILAQVISNEFSISLFTRDDRHHSYFVSVTDNEKSKTVEWRYNEKRDAQSIFDFLSSTSKYTLLTLVYV